MLRGKTADETYEFYRDYQVVYEDLIGQKQLPNVWGKGLYIVQGGKTGPDTSVYFYSGDDFLARNFGLKKITRIYKKMKSSVSDEFNKINDRVDDIARDVRELKGHRDDDKQRMKQRINDMHRDAVIVYEPHYTEREPQPKPGEWLDISDSRLYKRCLMWNCRNDNMTIGTPIRVIRRWTGRDSKIVGFFDSMHVRWDKAERK